MQSVAQLSIEGAKDLTLISGGPNLGMFEVNEAAKIITEHADPNARVILGRCGGRDSWRGVARDRCCNGVWRFPAEQRIKSADAQKAPLKPRNRFLHARPSFLQTEWQIAMFGVRNRALRCSLRDVVDDNEQLPRRSIRTRTAAFQQTEEGWNVGILSGKDDVNFAG